MDSVVVKWGDGGLSPWTQCGCRVGGRGTFVMEHSRVAEEGRGTFVMEHSRVVWGGGGGAAGERGVFLSWNTVG